MMKAVYFLAALAGLANSIKPQQPVWPGMDQPAIGFGTWHLDVSPENTTAAVTIAIAAGYRQIDCAPAYNNEKAVGKGIAQGLKAAGLSREDIWVTSKLPNDHHIFTDEDLPSERVEQALDQSLLDLGLNYLDLYLMHWPVLKEPTSESTGPSSSEYEDEYEETWQAMIQLLQTNKTRNVGISNFSPDQLRSILVLSKKGDQIVSKPAVHQMELHPYLPQSEWLKIHKALGINVTAYSPLGNTNPAYNHSHVNVTPILDNYFVNDIATNNNCTAAQVLLAWGMARGTSVLTKSNKQQHIIENYGSLHCHLRNYELLKIDDIGEKPHRFNDPSHKWSVELFDDLDEDTVNSADESPKSQSGTEDEEGENETEKAARKLEAILDLLEDWPHGGE